MTDYSVTTYNPYNMYWNYGYNQCYPAFCGAAIQQNTVPNYYNGCPQWVQQPDTVSFEASKQIQAKTEKQRLSKGTKFGIGAGVVIGLGVLAYLITKGKIGSNSVKQLAEHINFQQAKTYEEAIQFGKTHLGIKDYKGFETKDLEVINYINEGFVNISNKFKGKICTPKIVEYAELNDIKALQGVDRFKNKLYVDKQIYGNIDHEIQKGLDGLITKNADGSYSMLKADCCEEDRQYFMSLIRKFNINKTKGIDMPFNEKVRLYQNLEEYVDCLGQNVYKPVSEFGAVYHEGWHLLDPKLLTRSKSKSSIDQTIARTVSDYATTDEAEFIAEFGRKYMEGHSLTKEAVDLYNKLKGVQLPLE